MLHMEHWNKQDQGEGMKFEALRTTPAIPFMLCLLSSCLLHQGSHNRSLCARLHSRAGVSRGCATWHVLHMQVQTQNLHVPSVSTDASQ